MYAFTYQESHMTRKFLGRCNGGCQGQVRGDRRVRNRCRISFGEKDVLGINAGDGCTINEQYFHDNRPES